MLRGELVNLRAIERSDWSALSRWLNDPEVMRGWAFPAAVMSGTEVQRRIEQWLHEEAEQQERPSAFVIETLDAIPVGLIVLSRERARHRSIEVSLVIGERDRWGKGLGTDALRTICDACFSYWRYHRIELRSEASNVRAHAVYAKCGFTREAMLRQASWVDGGFEDVYVFSLLATDPEATNPA